MFKKCILVLQTANSVPAEEIVACANGLLHLPNLRLLRKRSLKRAWHHWGGGAMIGVWLRIERKCPLRN